VVLVVVEVALHIIKNKTPHKGRFNKQTN